MVKPGADRMFVCMALSYSVQNLCDQMLYHYQLPLLLPHVVCSQRSDQSRGEGGGTHNLIPVLLAVCK